MRSGIQINSGVHRLATDGCLCCTVVSRIVRHVQTNFAAILTTLRCVSVGSETETLSQMNLSIRFLFGGIEVFGLCYNHYYVLMCYRNSHDYLIFRLPFVRLWSCIPLFSREKESNKSVAVPIALQSLQALIEIKTQAAQLYQHT